MPEQEIHSIIDPPDEHALLLACLRQILRPDHEPPLQLPPQVNWQRLLTLAQDHQVVTLLNKSLRNSDSVPVPARRWMDNYCRTVVSHNLSLASELAGVLDVLDQAAISAVPFKGPAWTKRLYGNLSDRQIADLDLFIDPPSVSQACRVLGERGFIPLAPAAGPANAPKDIVLIQPLAGIHLELHWSACEPSRDARLARLRLWEPHSTTTLLTHEIPLPSPENILFLLAIHGFRDGWNSLKWVCDIAALLRAFPHLDFGNILSRAAAISRLRLLLVPLALVNRLLDVSLPSSVAEAIASDPAISAIAAQIVRRHYTAEADYFLSQAKAVSNRLYLEWFRVQMSDSRWERLRRHAGFLFGLLAPNENDRSYFAGNLPRPFYWLLKPWRLFRSYGPARFLQLGRQFLARYTP